MNKGRSLELYFIDGLPDGMLTAEVFNWTGHVLKLPRTRIKDALLRKESGHTGVYILLGENENGPLAYIGEAEDLGARLRGHVSQKDWWETAVLITSTANNLHKAHVKYLESRLVEIALSSKQIPLENSTTPTRSSLSEAATANMEEFLETLQIVLPAIQVNLLDNKTQPRISMGIDKGVNDIPKFQILSPKTGIKAFARLVEGEIIVQAGSVIRETWVGSRDSKTHYFHLREHLETIGVIAQRNGQTQFVKDYHFSSPSAAAAVIYGRSSNGRMEWKLTGEKTTYADWEKAQLAKLDQNT